MLEITEQRLRETLDILEALRMDADIRLAEWYPLTESRVIIKSKLRRMQEAASPGEVSDGPKTTTQAG